MENSKITFSHSTCALKGCANDIESVCNKFHLCEVVLHSHSIAPVKIIKHKISVHHVNVSALGKVLIPICKYFICDQENYVLINNNK